MEELKLADGFSVGDPRMDYQHGEMVRLLNAMLRADGTTVDSEDFSLQLTRATEYAVAHFREEEQLMTQAGYPNLAEHRQAHKYYRKHVAELCLRAMDKESDAPAKLLDFLMKWWRHHILAEDAAYRPYLEKMAGRQP